jgi:Na+/H+ antiporter NhaD/arsenite permease-like protein
LIWGLPFAGVLASVAFFPIVLPRFWHRRMGLVCGLWCAALLVPETISLGLGAMLHGVWHSLMQDYLPFITVLLALYTVGGGIQLRGGPFGRPAGNTLLLCAGTLLAGVMGTTGAAMTLIHPLLRANAYRRKRRHLAMFFIMLVANIGGATTPLGGPPLFMGFLRGVPFFWPLRNLLPPMLVLTALMLAVFYLLDRRQLAAEQPAVIAPPPTPLRLRGWRNVWLLLVIVATVLGMGIWHPGDVALLGLPVPGERLAGMLIFLAVTLVSVWITPRAVHEYNMFSWGPMEEVGTLFLAIFITIAPVLAILHAGFDGPLAPLLYAIVDKHNLPQPLPLFWLGGALSAFLDNGPTYLVFFELAGGDPKALTTSLAPALRALSAGAMFFGALTYIGNAPNLMICAIASRRGIRMPGFFGYMAWSCGLLLPAFAALGYLFFRR